MKKSVILSMLIGVLIMLSGSIQSYSADSVKITGEIIDTYCYNLMGAKGESHRACAIACIKKGIPAGLLEDGTNKVYILLPNKEGTSLPDAVIDKVAKIVTITGKVYMNGGSQFLTIETID
jgi:hypothetical protein